jgi:hypothetical protein
VPHEIHKKINGRKVVYVFWHLNELQQKCKRGGGAHASPYAKEYIVLR